MSLIIWDILFLEGTIILFKAALGILKVLKKELMELDSIEELTEFIDNRQFSFHDVSEIVYFLLLRRFEFDNHFINKLRKTHEKKIMKEMNYYSINKLVEEQIKFEQDLKCRKLAEGDLTRNSCLGVTEKCNLDWPLCIYDKFFKFNLINYLYFRTADEINLIEDYFYSNQPCRKSRDRLSNDNLSNITEGEIRNAKNDIKKKESLLKRTGDSKKVSLKSENEYVNISLLDSNLTFKQTQNENNLEFTNDKFEIKNIQRDYINSSDGKSNDPTINFLTPKQFRNKHFEIKDFNIQSSKGEIQNKDRDKDLDTFQNFEKIKISNHINEDFNDNISDYKGILHISEEKESLKNSFLCDVKSNDLVNECQNKNNKLFIDNGNFESGEEEEILEIDENYVFSLKDEDILDNQEYYDEAEENLISNEKKACEFSFDKQQISKKEKMKDILFIKKKDSVFDERRIDKIENNKIIHLKRSSSNQLKKIKDIRDENTKRLNLYRSLLINRRKHYCQLINEMSNLTFKNKSDEKQNLSIKDKNKRTYNKYRYI